MYLDKFIMKILLLGFILMLSVSNLIYAQVQLDVEGAAIINNPNPDPNAILDVQSTDKGVLLPRMTSLQKNAIDNPSEGMTVYDLETHSYWIYSESNWNEIAYNQPCESQFSIVNDAVSNTMSVSNIISFNNNFLIEQATKIEVCININHTWVDDLDILLISPDNLSLELSTDNGSSGDNYNQTCFSTEATVSITDGSPPFTGDFLPEDSFDQLVGGQIAGDWTLMVSDDEIGANGVILNWSLSIGECMNHSSHNTHYGPVKYTC